jgi:DnaK suppressor protein
MASTPISQPAAGRPRAPRHRGTVRSSMAQSLALQVRTGQARSSARRAEQRPGQASPGGLARRRAELEARWRDRLERVTALSLAYHDEAASAAAGPEGGARAASRRARQLGRQAVAERQALAEIEAALERIAAGRYGRCEECGRTITSAVLSATPQSRYCAACTNAAAPARPPLQYSSRPARRPAFA